MSVLVTDAFIDSCGFRMFDLAEIARTMVMADHPRGGEYAIRGNKRERMAKYGNAVTPPASQLILIFFTTPPAPEPVDEAPDPEPTPRRSQIKGDLPGETWEDIFTSPLEAA